MIAQPDITLLLDLDGVIRDVTLSSAMPEEASTSWVGRRWEDTVGELGGAKARRIVEDARTDGISAFRQITQRFPNGLELPMEYTIVLLGGRAGLLAIGKNLQAVAELQSRLVAAQQAMERDYWKLRDLETRYRAVFDAANNAVVMISAVDYRLVEANPAARQALGIGAEKLDGGHGTGIFQIIAPPDRASLQSMLDSVREHGKAPAIRVKLTHDTKTWMVRASILTGEKGSVFLLQMQAAGAETPAAVRREAVSIENLIDCIPDGFVVVDRDGVVQQANQAFLELVQAPSKSAVVGERLARWIWQPGADAGVVLSNVQRHGDIRLLSTSVSGEFGTMTEVEISAGGSVDTGAGLVALVLRNVSRRLPKNDEHSGSARALIALDERQVGKRPLRQLVRGAVEKIENQYVKEALELAAGNRTAAAELLGLSRQSLYAKLARYKLDGDDQSYDRNLGEGTA